MLDMGFREDIEAITEVLAPAPERQTFVFSATMSKAIQQVAREVLSDNHVYLNCVSEEDSPVHEHVPQYHTVLPSASEQLSHLLRVLAHDQLTNPGKSKTILFLPTTKLTQFVARVLRESKHYLPAGRATYLYELHSKLSMNARTRTSSSFRNDKRGASILITSDVSARGIDYPGVTRVIQVGVPSSADQYVHRVGRTGRKGGVQGRGDLILLPWEQGFLQACLADMPLKPITSNDLKDAVVEAAARYDSDPKAFFPAAGAQDRDEGRGRRFFDVAPPITRFDRNVEERIKSLDDGRCIAKDAYESEGDAYFTEVEEVFGSLLGYYAGRFTEMRARKDAVLKGLKDWTIQAAGMERPPHVSENFLKRIGYGSEKPMARPARAMSFDRRRSSGSSWDKPDRNRRSRSDPPPWMGRGSKSRKAERDTYDRDRHSRY